MNHRRCALYALLIWFFSVLPVFAVPVEVLEPGREWRVGKIEITGNEHFSDSELYTEMLTQSRPWYRPWEARPLFDPITFKTDLERLGRFYESHGYYKNSVSYDLEIDEAQGIVNPKINIDENSPVIIAQVDIDIAMNPQDQDGQRRNIR
jgi:outer membrane protein assembly factor BamA